MDRERNNPDENTYLPNKFPEIWEDTQKMFNKEIKSIEELNKTFFKGNSKLFEELEKSFPEDGEKFLKVYKNISKLVLDMKDIFPDGEIEILKSKTTDKIILTRKEVALIFVLGFFDIFGLDVEKLNISPGEFTERCGISQPTLSRDLHYLKVSKVFDVEGHSVYTLPQDIGANHISIKKLWDYLCTYCYLPRLASYSVLEDAIQEGLHSTEYFALAAGISNDRYLDLKVNTYVGFIDKPAPEQPPVGPGNGGGDNPGGRVTPPGPGPKQPPEKPEAPDKHFYMSAPLDTTRIGRDVSRLMDEIINHLNTLDGCNVQITLEVTAERSEGFPVPIIRTVSENCRTLKIKDFGFEK